MVDGPRRVLIVGGGPCGLVTLRNLVERGTLEDVQLVERRDDVGGIWYQPADERGDRWPSPAYPELIGNVIPEFLSFSGAPFPAPPREDQPFPTLCETHAYLAAFARPLLHGGRIRLRHEVIEVAEIPAGEGGGWRVVLIDWSGSQGVRKEERWDGVVVTTVWYDNAHYPRVDGLEDVLQAGRVQHARTWRGPRGYEGKRVLVVGNANSANDVAAQLADVARSVYRSVRRPSIFPSLPDARIQDVGPVLQFSRTAADDTIAVHLRDRTLAVDAVVLGTGYDARVPYLAVLDPGLSLAPLTGPHVHPPRVPSLYRHVLYAPNPSLAFVGALVSFVPFAMADVTSTWLALVWAGRVDVPATVEGRLADERARLETLRRLRSETADPSDLVSFHVLGRYELPYAQETRAEIVQAAPELGDVLAPWDDAQDARRLAMYATKLDSLYILAGKDKDV